MAEQETQFSDEPELYSPTQTQPREQQQGKWDPPIQPGSQQDSQQQPYPSVEQLPQQHPDAEAYPPVPHPSQEVYPVQSANLPASAFGAVLGGGFGGLIWFGIAYLTGFEFGLIAMFVGALSGWGAVSVGKVQNETVGCIAALAGVIGIFAASYASYYYGMRCESAKVEVREEFCQAMRIEDPSFDSLSPEEKDALFEEAYEQALKEAPGYLAAVSSSPWDLVMTVLFGGLGLYYGFRVGSGVGKTADVWK